MKIARPKPHEPIRLVPVQAGPRYRVVLDIGETVDRRRRQVTRTFRTLGEARQFVLDTRAALAAGTFTAPDATTLDAVSVRWLTSRRDVREVTRLGYQSVLRPVLARIGQTRVQDLRRSDVESLVRWLTVDGGQRGRGLSHRSVVFTLGTLRQVLAYAVSEGVIPANPAVGVKAPRKQRTDTRDVAVWSVSDMLAFREVADRDEWAAGWRFTLAGLRRSEVLGLRWPCVDLSDGLVRVEAGRVALDGHRCAVDEPKSGASWRVVPIEAMHPGTTTLLRSLSARQAADRLAAGTAYVDAGGFVLVDGLGQPIRPEAYSDRFARLCREAEVPVIRLHDVRHSVALMLHRAGQAPADAAALLGHSVSVHLTTYVPRTALGAQTAATALGQVLGAVL